MSTKMSLMYISNDITTCSVNNTDHLMNDPSIHDEILECPPKTASEPQLVICNELKNLSKDVTYYSRTSGSTMPEEEEYVHCSSVIITDIIDRLDLDSNNISTVNLNILLNPPSINDDNMKAMEL